MRRIVMITAHYIGEMETDEDAIRVMQKILKKKLPKSIEIDGEKYYRCYEHTDWKPKTDETFKYDRYYEHKEI